MQGAGRDMAKRAKMFGKRVLAGTGVVDAELVDGIHRREG